MSRFEFWSLVLAALVALPTIIGLLVFLPKRAKPQILDAQNYFISFMTNNEEIRFDLLSHNKGSIDCSITSVDLIWPNGLTAELEGGVIRKSTPLPKTIPAHSTERIEMSGFARKEWGTAPESKPVLQPNQTSAKATVAVKFNTGKIIPKTITFTFVECIY